MTERYGLRLKERGCVKGRNDKTDLLSQKKQNKIDFNKQLSYFQE